MSRTKKEKRELKFRPTSIYGPPSEEEWIRTLDASEIAQKMTPEQAVQAVDLLRCFVDGCSYVMSRNFQKGLSCGQDNGRGFDCYSCAARSLLQRIGGYKPE